MSKNRNSRSDKEHTKEQKLIHENSELKRALARLRKRLERIDLDRYQEIREIIDESELKKREEDPEKELARIKKRWVCHDCSSGTLYIHRYAKIDQEWYFRQCDNCSHRTKAQPFSTNVPGLFPPEPEVPKTGSQGRK